MTFLYGTSNEAKLRHMKYMLEGMDINILGLGEMDGLAPSVDETGSDPLQNAEIKAVAYYKAFKLPVFSCDSGLYIEGLEDDRQPGVHVRNIGGKYFDDDEMIAYYSQIAVELGGRCVARYKNAICAIIDETHMMKDMGDKLSGEKFIIASKPHPKRRPGFPLDSLSINIVTGKYYFDMNETRFSSTTGGFRDFFSRLVERIGSTQQI